MAKPMSKIRKAMKTFMDAGRFMIQNFKQEEGMMIISIHYQDPESEGGIESKVLHTACTAEFVAMAGKMDELNFKDMFLACMQK